MSRKWFGTDGIRGVANQKLTPELALKIGIGAGRWMRESGQPMTAVIGRDTRQSGSMLGAALAAGLCSAGVKVTTLAVVPTPTVSFAVRRAGFGLGVVISASHNPAPDNGIKLFGANGAKLPDAAELRIEELADGPFDGRPLGGEVGTITADRSLVEDYLDSLEKLLPERLDGMRVAVDSANGAAYELGSEILRRLGADVVETGVVPDGANINAQGGATKPETVQELTVTSGAAIGIAFDGDADRAVFSDSQGRLINGDRTIALWASHWRGTERMPKAVVVGTVMSNLAVEHYLSSHGVEFERAPVGDKYVSERMRATSASIGGEQSGHIIFSELGPTGDGLVTMIETLRVLRRTGQSSSSFVDAFDNWPQLLINVSVASRDGWETAPNVSQALLEAEKALNGSGRINVRPSGTQPMIRVMVEAESAPVRDSVAEAVVAAMRQDLGGEVYSRVDLTHALGD